MTTELVSVVLPTHNRAGTIERAVRSVLAQSHEELELIVVDDASDDGTHAALARVRDPRMRVLRNPQRLGVSASRNRGAGEARGRWIAFQDSDDEWRIEKLSRQLAAAAPEAVLVLCGNLYVNDATHSFRGVASREAVVDITSQVIVRIPGAQCFMLRRADFLEAGGFDTGMNCFEDWELALRLSQRGRVMLANEPLVICQRTPNSLFSTEQNYIPNLEKIFARHGHRLRTVPDSWSRYCNLLGQTHCQFGAPGKGRRQFLTALRARPLSPRTWANLLMSWFGVEAFRAYVRLGRSLKARTLRATAPA